MAKYSFELKQKVAQAYMNGEGGYQFLSQKYKVASKSTVEKWIKVYKELGSNGLLRSCVNYQIG